MTLCTTLRKAGKIKLELRKAPEYAEKAFKMKLAVKILLFVVFSIPTPLVCAQDTSTFDAGTLRPSESASVIERKIQRESEAKRAQKKGLPRLEFADTKLGEVKLDEPSFLVKKIHVKNESEFRVHHDTNIPEQ